MTFDARLPTMARLTGKAPCVGSRRAAEVCEGHTGRTSQGLILRTILSDEVASVRQIGRIKRREIVQTPVHNSNLPSWKVKREMPTDLGLIGQDIRTPRAAGVAGIVFALLLITSEVMIWLHVPSALEAQRVAVAQHSRGLAIALNLRPFAGIAFLWFMGVIRDRLGNLEDRFFATIFLGSGVLYLAMMFLSGAMAHAVLTLLATGSHTLITSSSYDLARQEVFGITAVYATRMAGVFMMSTSTLLMQTRIAPRWVAILGYMLALVLLLSAGTKPWLALAFPLWVMLVSKWMLHIRGQKTGADAATASHN